MLLNDTISEMSPPNRCCVVFTSVLALVVVVCFGGISLLWHQVIVSILSRSMLNLTLQMQNQLSGDMSNEFTRVQDSVALLESGTAGL